MTLDEKLKEILLSPFKDSGNMTAMHDDKGRQSPYIEQISKIKQAFIDEGWVSPEQRDKALELTNQMVNLAHSAFKIPSTVYLAVSKDQKTAEKLMTGQEWYAKFEQELILMIAMTYYD